MESSLPVFKDAYFRMSDLYIVGVSTLQVCQTAYWAFVVCTYWRVLSKQTNLFLLGLFLTTGWVYAVRLFLRIKMGEEETTPQNISYYSLVNSLKFPVEILFYLQFGYIVVQMQKALSIIKSKSIEELTRRLARVDRFSGRVLRLYLLIVVPDLVLYIGFSFNKTIPPAQEELAAALMLAYYILNLITVVFDLWFVNFTYNVISSFAAALYPEVTDFRFIKFAIGLVLVTVFVGKTVQNALYPVRHVELISKHYGIDLPTEYDKFKEGSYLGKMLYVFNALSFFLLANIVLIAIDQLGRKQREASQKKVGQSEPPKQQASQPLAIQTTIQNDDEDERSSGSFTPFHTTIEKMSNSNPIESEDGPSNEEGFTVIAESEFNYEEDDSESGASSKDSSPQIRRVEQSESIYSEQKKPLLDGALGAALRINFRNPSVTDGSRVSRSQEKALLKDLLMCTVFKFKQTPDERPAPSLRPPSVPSNQQDGKIPMSLETRSNLLNEEEESLDG